MLDPAHHLVADHQLRQRAAQPRLQVAQVVNDVGPAQRLDHQHEGRLGRGLLVNQFGLGATAQAEYRQAVVLAQGVGHAPGVGRAIGADHGPHVQTLAAPARRDKGRSLALEL